MARNFFLFILLTIFAFFFELLMNFVSQLFVYMVILSIFEQLNLRFLSFLIMAASEEEKALPRVEHLLFLLQMVLNVLRQLKSAATYLLFWFYHLRVYRFKKLLLIHPL